MKKKLESELMSIAHNILRLKGKEDVIALHQESKKLYEKLTILRFIEEHFGDLKPLVGKSEVVNKFEEMATKVIDRNTLVPENNPHEEDIMIPGMDTIKDMVAEMPMQESLDDILADFKSEPTFVERTPQTTNGAVKIVETKPKSNSLNQKFGKNLNIGLNDRIAFVKYLFNNSMEDYNRVISQLNTIEDENEALQFVSTMVKPDYQNWEGKEAYEERFMEILQQKFS
ncbi:hypothetical protein [Ascidiimonas sp. W6]|uniref:hypothetical protein n=1 Tax=Ascidiimonas meishanensis TaxID=3128903 RepID=UPI0030EE1A2D